MSTDFNVKSVLIKINQAIKAVGASFKAFRKKRPLLMWSFYTFFGAIALGVLTVGVFITLIGFGFYGKIPTHQELLAIQNPIASEVISSDGLLMGKYYAQDRLNVELKEISPALINALIATEDARFFEHMGVDLRSWVRVFFKSVLMKDKASGGGSTLSQQLAKNLYPRRDYKHFSLIVNKLREVFIARRLEQLYAKEELLQLYVNTVAFSNNTYGIRVASKRFFNKAPSELKVEEAAVLVAMLKATTVYNPMNNPEGSRQRRNVVLDLMYQYDYLSKPERDSLQQIPIRLEFTRESHNDGLATYFRESLRLELKEWLDEYNQEYKTNYNLYTDGLKIYTTINARMQQMAEKAVTAHLKALQSDFDKHWVGHEKPWEDERLLKLARQSSTRYQELKAEGWDEVVIDSIFNVPVEMTVFDWDKGSKKVKMSPMDSIRFYFQLLNAGFLAMEPNTGVVRAWVGGTDYKYFKYDHVHSLRQVGSTFKPVVYAAAIRKGIHPCSQISNRLVTYPQFENWQPKNSDGKYGGYYSMEGALSKSINAITVNLVMRTGSKPVVELAKQMGITTEIPAVPSIALGAAEVSLFDMIRVYGTFANRGKNVTPVYIAKIVDRNGHILRKHDEEAATNVKEALTEDEADMMNKMLQSTINTGTGVRLRYRYNFTTPLAGKTGTSQNHSDGWFIGYTPSLVVGAWVGAESPAVYFRDLNLGQGANTALPIFAEFWKQLLEEEQYDRYTKEVFPELSLKAKSMMNCSTFAKSDSLYQQNRAKAVENARAVEVGMNEVKSSPKLVSGETFMQ